MDNTPVASGPRYFTCPICETGTLRPLGGDSAKCSHCGCLVGGAILTTLDQIQNLSEALGNHACECGHPEMRLLPDGVFLCPACHSEVLPVEPSRQYPEASHSEAYWSGWMDGRFHDAINFTQHGGLSRWESPTDRLDYYRGHRIGREARLSSKRGSLKAS